MPGKEQEVADGDQPAYDRADGRGGPETASTRPQGHPGNGKSRIK